MKRGVALVLGVVLAVTVVRADDFDVEFDPNTDFTAVRTFSLGAGHVNSARPELDNTLFVKKLAAAVRTALLQKGLTEVVDRADVVVDFSIAGRDISTTERGMPIRVGPTGRRGGLVVSTGPQSVRFAEATLVIDMTMRGNSAAVWRGVYRDEESTGSKLVEKLPSDARKLLTEYPPKK